MSSTLLGSSLRIGSLMRVEQEPMLKAAKKPTAIAVIRKMRARIEHVMAKALKKRNLKGKIGERNERDIRSA
jgi:hypothetical protein